MCFSHTLMAQWKRNAHDLLVKEPILLGGPPFPCPGLLEEEDWLGHVTGPEWFSIIIPILTHSGTRGWLVFPISTCLFATGFPLPCWLTTGAEGHLNRITINATPHGCITMSLWKKTLKSYTTCKVDDLGTTLIGVSGLPINHPTFGVARGEGQLRVL